MQELTNRQRRVLTYFREAVRDTGTPPSVRQVMAKCGLSPRGAQLQLKALADNGLLIHQPNKKPAYLPLPIKSSSVPIMGRAPAGLPADQPEDHTGWVQIPWRVSNRAFAIHVDGESMHDAQILNGDVAVIDPGQDVVHGHIVLAEMNGGSTIKRFRKAGSKWWLEPANVLFEKQEPTRDEDHVVGRVVAIVRSLVIRV